MSYRNGKTWEGIICLFDSYNVSVGYIAKLTKYLQANYTLFPLYLNPGTSMDTVYPIQNSWTSPMYFRKRK